MTHRSRARRMPGGWNLTVYGKQFYRLAAMFSAGVYSCEADPDG